MNRYVMEASPLGPSRKVKAAIRKAVKDINALPMERQARLERLFLSKYGVGNDCTLLANSLKELCFVICRTFAPRRVLIVGPALNLYQEAAAASGAVVEVLSGDEESAFIPDMHTLVEKADGSDIVFIATPNRISGRSLSESFLTDVLSALSLKKCITVIDESLIEFTGDEGSISDAPNGPHSIVLRTTAYYSGLPGLELACAVAGPKVIESLQRQLQSGPSIPAMEAARTALKDKSYRKLSDRFMKEEKVLFKKAISRLPGMVMYDSDTNIFLLKSAGLAEEIARKADRAGLAVEQCTDIVGLNGQFLRVSVMKHDHNLKLIKLLNMICLEKVDRKNNSA